MIDSCRVCCAVEALSSRVQAGCEMSTSTSALRKYPSTVNASILCTGPHELLRDYFNGITIGNLTQLREEWLVDAAVPSRKLLMHLFIEEHRAYLRGDVEASITSSHVAFEAKPFTSPVPEFAACGCKASLQKRFASSVAEPPK
jgi:hypothetical protein